MSILISHPSFEFPENRFMCSTPYTEVSDPNCSCFTPTWTSNRADTCPVHQGASHQNSELVKDSENNAPLVWSMDLLETGEPMDPEVRERRRIIIELSMEVQRIRNAQESIYRKGSQPKKSKTKKSNKTSGVPKIAPLKLSETARKQKARRARAAQKRQANNQISP